MTQLANPALHAIENPMPHGLLTLNTGLTQSTHGPLFFWTIPCWLKRLRKSWDHSIHDPKNKGAGNYTGLFVDSISVAVIKLLR